MRAGDKSNSTKESRRPPLGGAGAFNRWHGGVRQRGRCKTERSTLCRLAAPAATQSTRSRMASRGANSRTINFYDAHMSSAAAFFDLDKTVLAKSSSLAFAKQLHKGGLLSRSDVLRAAYRQFLYTISGADDDLMSQAREQLSALIAGWPVQQVSEIVNEALEEVIVPIVYQEAVDLFEEHHAAGRDVIIISSSGTEVVEPIGVQLGVDKAIGTQAEVVDGLYTGKLLLYAYGQSKADIIVALAADVGYDLRECYAYSDSITDVPMLSVVGHPFATNPDKNLRAYAEEHDWPILKFDKPVAMRKHETSTRTKAAAAAGAVALGLAWYARHRRSTS